MPSFRFNLQICAAFRPEGIRYLRFFPVYTVRIAEELDSVILHNGGVRLGYLVACFVLLCVCEAVCVFLKRRLFWLELTGKGHLSLLIADTHGGLECCRPHGTSSNDDGYAVLGRGELGLRGSF